MRSRTADWFETKIRYEKTMDDGLQKKVTEQYTVDALSFTEAESSITEEMSSYISGEYEVSDIKKAAYKEVFFSETATTVGIRLSCSSSPSMKRHRRRSAQTCIISFRLQHCREQWAI